MAGPEQTWVRLTGADGSCLTYRLDKVAGWGPAGEAVKAENPGVESVVELDLPGGDVLLVREKIEEIDALVRSATDAARKA